MKIYLKLEKFMLIPIIALSLLAVSLPGSNILKDPVNIASKTAVAVSTITASLPGSITMPKVSLSINNKAFNSPDENGKPKSISKNLSLSSLVKSVKDAVTNTAKAATNIVTSSAKNLVNTVSMAASKTIQYGTTAVKEVIKVAEKAAVKVVEQVAKVIPAAEKIIPKIQAASNNIQSSVTNFNTATQNKIAQAEASAIKNIDNASSSIQNVVTTVLVGVGFGLAVAACIFACGPALAAAGFAGAATMGAGLIGAGAAFVIGAAALGGAAAAVGCAALGMSLCTSNNPTPTKPAANIVAATPQVAQTVCPAGTTMTSTGCKKPVTPSCQPGYSSNGVGGCIKDIILCANGSLPVNGACGTTNKVCAVGQTGTPPNCITDVIKENCPPGSTGIAPNCVIIVPEVCPPNTTGIAPNCNPIQQTVNCLAGYSKVGDSCVKDPVALHCTNGLELNPAGTACVSPTGGKVKSCSPLVSNPTQTGCIDPEPSIICTAPDVIGVGGSCVTPPPVKSSPPTCPTGQAYDIGVARCVPSSTPTPPGKILLDGNLVDISGTTFVQAKVVRPS